MEFLEKAYIKVMSTLSKSRNLASCGRIIGHGVKRHKGRKGELRTVIGVTRKGRVEPLKGFANTERPQIERIVKERIKKNQQYQLPYCLLW